MKYLKLFQTQDEYDAYSIVDFPNISYVKGAKSVFYNTEVPFYIEAIEDLTVTMSFYSNEKAAYSLDKINWVNYTSSISIPAGNKVFFKANMSTSSSRDTARFNISAASKIGGNIMSMLYGEDYSGKTEVTNHCFKYMFYNQATIQDASALLMPATTLGSNCYQHMFAGCTSLVNAPKILPAPILPSYCYCDMFGGCASLANAPALPATTLGTDCYRNMFKGCINLTTAPELPAAIQMGQRCCQYMFYGCTQLCYIKALSASNPYDYYTNWVSGVASTGTFVKSNGASWANGANGIPSGWTVETAEA